jgi:putative transposase
MMPKEKWRSGYTTTTTSDPHSSLGNKTPAEARRAFEQFKGSANDALAQNETEEYQTQTRKLPL